MQKMYITELSEVDRDRLREATARLPLSRVYSTVAAHSMASIVYILPRGEAVPHM